MKEKGFRLLVIANYENLNICENIGAGFVCTGPSHADFFPWP